MYSSNAIRWNCYNADENSGVNAEKIINWWNKLDKKKITILHITGMDFLEDQWQGYFILDGKIIC